MSLNAAFDMMRGQIGTEVGVSNWIAIDQPMIDRFADVTHDDQWIHTDPTRAETTDVGGTIAHGFLTLSLASRFAYDCFPMLPGQSMGINYGFNRLRFISPVRPGDRLRGRFTLSDVSRRSDTELMRTMALTIEIDGRASPALVAEWLALAVFVSTP